MKNKNVAGILALLGGMFGVHRFYLGQKGLGVLYFMSFFVGIMLTAASDGEFPLILAPVAIGLMDAVLFFVMPQEDFDEKYNTKRKKSVNRRFEREGNVQRQSLPSGRPAVKKAIDDPHKRMGIERFRDFDYLGAIESFQKSLQQNYESPSTHFNLACAYSMLELPKDAFFHLEKSVEFGFDAFEKISSHQALAFLRTHPDMETFVRNGYKVLGSLPQTEEEEIEDRLELSALDEFPEAEKVELKSSSTNNLLDQLLQLGELKEKGLLSEEEFNKQKQKLLRD